MARRPWVESLIPAFRPPKGAYVHAVAVPPASVAAPRPRPAWYVALGDSLSRGLQPRSGHAGAGRDTNQGYPDVLARDLGLRLVKLGCPGETTTTMLRGGICYRGGASQVGAATRFLRAHRSDLALVTVDIGINDVVRCQQEAPGPRSAACLAAGLAIVERNLPTVVRQVRAAAGPEVPIVALDYYAPFVASPDRARAAWSHYVTGRLDATLSGVLGPLHVTVADTAGAFGLGRPLAVEAGEVCRLTWVCSPPPVGANLHANAAGYRAMAGSVERALRGDGLPPLGHLARAPGAAARLEDHQVGQRLPQGGAAHPELDLVPRPAPRDGQGHVPGGGPGIGRQVVQDLSEALLVVRP
jgi:lysophospholipase L1-like esterase